MHPKYPIDTAVLSQHFMHAIHEYQWHNAVPKEIARRMIQRLDVIKIDPKTILNAGARLQMVNHALQNRYKKSKLTLVDTTPIFLKVAAKKGFLRRWPAQCVQPTHLPFANQSFDLIFSNLWLNETNDLQSTVAEFARILKPNGLLMFSACGPDTLAELRSCFAKVGSYNNVHEFVDMHDIGDQCLQAGFSDPVMDMEKIRVTYSSLELLFEDLKYLGATNARQDRRRGLMGKGLMNALREQYEQFRQCSLLPATVEVIHGHAWAPGEMSTQSIGEQGEIVVPITSIKHAK